MSDFDAVVETFARRNEAFDVARTARLSAAYDVLNSLRARLDIPNVGSKMWTGLTMMSSGWDASLVPTRATVTHHGGIVERDSILRLDLDTERVVSLDARYLDDAAACLIALLDAEPYHVPGDVTYDRLALALASAYAQVHDG